MVKLSRYSPILVVDDDTFARRIVRSMLAELLYLNVAEAADGEEALALMEKHRFALVVSDWFMAPMSGLELLIALRGSEEHAKIPFIMMTAHSQFKFIEIARDAGATHYLQKPFALWQLREKLEGLYEQMPKSWASTQPRVRTHRLSYG